MDSENRHKQEDELLVLQAIYEGDVEDLRLEQELKEWRPVELLIHLRPTSSASERPSDVYVGIDLHVTCSLDYPNCPPKIELGNEKGLSKEDVTALQTMLTAKAEKLKKQEMLLELCQIVQTFLYEKNAPPEYISSHEGMKKRRVRQMQQQKTEEQLLRDSSTKREAEEIEAELMRRQDEQRLRTNESELRQRSASKFPEPSTRRTRRYTDVKDASTSTLLGDSNGVAIVFADGVEHDILRSSLPAPLRQPPHRMCVEWSGIYELTGKAVYVSEWTFECQLGKKTNRKAACMEELVNLLDAIEKEAQPLFKLSKHPNVCRYLALDTSRRFVTGKSFLQKIYVVRSMDEDEQPLSRALESRVKLPAETLSKIAKYILNALNFLHAKDILHKYILPDCIWEVPEKGYTLSDYYLRYRLLDLADCFCVCAQLPIEERTSIAGSGKSSRRSDIYCFGAVLTALANGEWSVRGDLLSQMPSMADQVLIDFLNHCFGLNADGWTASRLLEHNFILHGPVQRQNALVDSVATAAATADEGLPFDDISVGGQSRLGQEFSFLKWLGKGGFGDVIMVRNKLEGNVYALKRILLNPRSKMLNKKILREAKLFSRLNHENVVRYFNSWIEVISKPTDQRNDTAVPQRHSSPEDDSELFMRSNLRDLEANAPVVGESSVEWTTSDILRESASLLSSSSSDSEDESSPVGVFAPSFYRRRSSDSSDAKVIFEAASTEFVHEISDLKSNADPDDDKKVDTEAAEDTSSRVLYIQMEFCEGSTLRRAIDSGLLSSNVRRVWRLFREMLEGLKYIHGQGMIHRDIKPVNIFLDGHDHVKIGDFGLATQDLPLVETPTACVSLNESAASHGLTSNIGTALYVAPELIVPRKSGVKTPTYTSKVDIFSVGIVLFEMFYRPLEPGMERDKTLSSIRNGPIFPDDFGLSLPINTRETAKNVISRTLTIDSTKRPSAEELLACGEIPVEKMRNAQLQMAVKAISDKRSQNFQLIMASLFSRFPTSTLDYCFDQDIYKDAYLVEKALRMNRLERKLAEIFRIHGALPLITPLLTPASMSARSFFAFGPQLPPYLLMDKSGLIVSLPSDLRYGFARFAARNANSPLKRYAFGKAYRSGNQEEHPKEITECALNFLTAATGAATSTAEMLFILHQIGREIVGLRDRRCSLRLGHMKLIRAALLHIGVVDDNEQIRVIQALHNFMAGNTDARKLTDDMGLSSTARTTLFNVLSIKGPLDEVTAELHVLTNADNESVSRLTKEALEDLERIKTALDILLAYDKGADMIPLTIAVSFMERPDVNMDGVLFTASVEMMHKKKEVSFTFAVGGRYDTLVKTIRQRHLDKLPTVPLCMIGCSISMDWLAAIDASVTSVTFCSVLVCSQSGTSLIKEKLAFVRQLWTAGIAADFLHEPVDEREDVTEYCRKKGIAYLATMLDADSVLLKTFDNEGDLEIKLSYEVAIDVIRSEVKPARADSVGSTSLVPSTSSNKSNVGDAIHRSHSVGNTVHTEHSAGAATAAATFSNVKIRYAMLERPQANTKNYIKMQIWALLSLTVSKFSANTIIEVLATELPLSVILAITGVVDQKSTAVELTAAMVDVIKRFNKYKREVNIVFDELRSILLDGDRSVFAHKVIILYGKEEQAKEGFCRVIL